MPLGERDPNASGRDSRASLVSAGSRSVSKEPPQPTGHNSGLLSANPVVSSMLRTSTDLGNLGGIVRGSSLDMHNVPRAPPPRSGATSRMSTGSSVSNTSKRTSGRASAHQNWPSSSSGPRRPAHKNHHGPQYVADTLSPTTTSLPGSSPLFARGVPRDDRRARSLTYRSHPNLRMSTRSHSSLRSDQRIQRPRSPYDGYPPPRFPHSGRRPVSPATSDFTEQFSRRPFVNPNPSRGVFRGRVVSEVPFRRDQNGRIPLSVRPRSSACSTNSYDHEEIPPVPPIPAQHQAQNKPQTQYPHQHKQVYQHIAVDRARSLHSQGKGSVSSGSTGQREDSDAPSSDGPSPPTPKDGGSMGPLVCPTEAQTQIAHGVGGMKGESKATPFYLDGSEYYEQEFIHEARAVVLTGCVGRIMAIEEERGLVDTPKTTNDALVYDPLQSSTHSLDGPAELPASPVPRRLTRQLVQSALGPASPTNGFDVSPPVPNVETSAETLITDRHESVIVSRACDKQALNLSQLDEDKVNRCSGISQAATSLMESSTVELALQYSGANNNATSSTDAGPTEDGLSDLLDDYQHTETKGHIEPLTEISQDRPSQEGMVDKKTHHTPKSSDELSFKSCTYLPELPVKDSDAKSFKTANDMVTPERAVSVPVSGLHSSAMLKSEPQAHVPASVLPQSPPPTALRKKPALPVREPCFPTSASRTRSNTQISSRQGSTVASISPSIAGAAHTPPPVPPRESSASTEAQRSTAVANFLARFSLGRAQNSSRKKSVVTETVSPPDGCGVDSKSSSYQQKRSNRRSISCFDGTSDGMTTPIKSPVDQELASENRIPAGVPKRVYNTPTDFGQSGVQQTPKSASVPPIEFGHSGIRDIFLGDSQHWHSQVTPSPMIPEPSSAYSPEDGYSSSKPRAQSSPAGLSTSLEHSHRRSQSTTHLEWYTGPSSSTPSFDTSERRPRNSNDQDDTTTDLSFSGYRRLHVPMSYLEDVKEESHEDSSLNTSTSNLKQRPIFRFPNGGALSSQPSIRESGDEPVRLARDASVRSRRNSGLTHTRGLPSMNFSRINLVEGLGDILSSRPGSFEGSSDARGSFGCGLVRSLSEGNMREKYKSVLIGLEGVRFAVDAAQSGIEQDIIRGTGNAVWSRKEILSALENITVPTVSEVTRRITELIPLKDNDHEEMDQEEFPEETEIMENARARLQEVGGPSVKRSSSRLRPLPGSAQLQVMDDVLYEKLTSPQKKNSVDDGIVETRKDAEVGEAQGGSKRTHEKMTLAELQAPSPKKLRTHSRSLRTSLESFPSLNEGTQYLRSLASTPSCTTTDTRPWNNESHYVVWTTTPEIDISFPQRVVVKGSPRPGPSPLRSSLSISSNASDTSLTGQTVSPATRRCPKVLRRSQLHATHQSTPHINASGYPTSSVGVPGRGQTHEAGDRYPTSSLSPPSNVNIQSIAHHSSHFSESDDETMAKKFKFSLRDRFGSKRRVPEEIDGENSRAAQELASDSLNDRNGVQDMSKMQDLHERAQEVAFGKRDTFPQASGMAELEYCAKNTKEMFMNVWDKIKAFFICGDKDHQEFLGDVGTRGRTKDREGGRIRELFQKKEKKKEPVEDVGNVNNINDFNRKYGTRF